MGKLDFETVNKLYLELSQVATAKTHRQIALEEIAKWTQAAVTALATGDIASGSKLHHKLRDLMIDFRARFEPQE